MAAILLAGFVAFEQLPISALPEVDYPTIQVLTFYPGAAPDVMASAVTAPLERQFGQVPGLSQMTSTSSGRSSHHCPGVFARSEHRYRGRARGASRYQFGANVPACGSPRSSDLQQDESGGHADFDLGLDVEHRFPYLR